jgi:hypothetical protein
MRLALQLFFFFFFFSLPMHADPEELFLEESKITEVPASSVISGNYFSVADGIFILGSVEGDAYLAGTQIVIEGVIHGDLVVVGGNVTILGTVKGNAKILAGQAYIEGSVEGRLHCLAVNIQVSSKGLLGKDAFFIAGNADFAGTAEQSVEAFVSNFKVSGVVKENFHTFVGWLKVTQSAQLLGSVHYRSNNTASIDPRAKIPAGVIFKPSILRDFMDMPKLSGMAIGSQIMGFGMNFFYTFIVGLLLIRFFPKKLYTMLSSLQNYPKQSFLWGLVVLFVIPCVCILLLITVLGTPFALTLIALNVISFYTIKVFPILWASNYLFGHIGWKPNTVKTLAAGQILYYAISFIPIIGWGFITICTILGLGATIVSQTKSP